MVSGFTFNTTPPPKPKESTVKGKTSSKKSAGKQAIQAGPSGKMHKFSGAGPQASDRTAVTQHAGKGSKFASGGPSGKMQGFSPVKGQKSGRTSQS